MLKNECSRNCWLAAALAGLLVWIFNGAFFAGLLMGLIAFLLLGSFLVWGLCNGRGGLAEDREVLGDEAASRNSDPSAEGNATILARAEQAVVDAGAAIAAGAGRMASKGREKLDDMRDSDDSGDNARNSNDASGKTRADRDDREDDRDEDDGLLDRAEDRLEKAGDAVKDAMGALAVRGKEALSSLTGKDDTRGNHREADDRAADESDAAVSNAADRSRVATGAAQPARLYDDSLSSDPRGGAADSGAVPAIATNVSPSGQAAIPNESARDEKPPKKPTGVKAVKAGKGEKKKAEKAAKSDKTGKAKKSDGKKADARKAGAKKDAKAAKAAKADRNKPETAAAASPQGTPDDLKEIKGVGPQLEKLLHENGVTSFAQIAGWSDADVDHHAGLIGRMGGRIRSDDWVAQAKILAEGGSTEFSRRVDEGEVY